MASLRPALLHALGHLSRVKFAREFARAAPDPRGTQEAKLRQLLSANAGTEYGAQHGFQSLKSPQEFAQRVPIMTPADLEPLVRRQMEGARNVLTAEPPVYYVRTTGSTGVPKHVPITRAYVNEFQRTVHVSLFHLRRLVPSAFLGRALYFVGSRRVAKAPDGCDVGTMSGFNFTEMPQVVRAVYAWPYELFEVQDLRARTLLSLVLAALGDVSLIAGIFPAPIVYLLRDLDAQAGVLARILRDGKLPSDLALTSVQRSFFEGLLKGPRRSLAQRMDRAASAPEGSRVPIALPSLRLVYCWTTATAGLYVPELQRRVGERVLVRDAIYSACEGWCSIPMGESEPGGALATTSHFY
ncbi:MAG: GH3 auxin-responsive promoter family protein, partial [Deltaproteobacteria bacterium]|nr:GH3 auxin-responsive promoter family protein [Deltaproteobacteria bacterium]